MKKGVKKKYFYFLFGVFILVLGSLIIYAQGLTRSHDAGEILITKNGFQMNLTEARDNNFFNYDNNPSVDYTNFLIKGHDADEIWVNASDEKMTLQDALDRSLSEHDILCSGGSVENFIFGFGEVGHLGSEVEILVEGDTKFLQDAINDGDLCGCKESYSQNCVDVSLSSLDESCVNQGIYNCESVCVGSSQKTQSEDCGGGKTCTSAGDCCEINRGQSCGTNECVNEAYDCNGVCVTESNNPSGTICNNGGGICDSNGNCENYWEGYACEECPFGYYETGYNWVDRYYYCNVCDNCEFTFRRHTTYDPNPPNIGKPDQEWPSWWKTEGAYCNRRYRYINTWHTTPAWWKMRIIGS